MKKKVEAKRRSFLKHVLAGTATIVGTAVLVRPTKVRSATLPDRLDETLYHESENFKKFYKTLRS